MNPMVNLSALLRALEGSPLWVTFLDRESGEVVVLPEGLVKLARSNRPANQPMEPRERAQLKLARTILADTAQRYLPGPKPADFPEYKAMQDFIASMEDRTVAYDLSQAIKARGAFRQFKAALTQFELKNDWLRFRDGALADYARKWAAERGFKVAGG